MNWHLEVVKQFLGGCARRNMMEVCLENRMRAVEGDAVTVVVRSERIVGLVLENLILSG